MQFTILYYAILHYTIYYTVVPPKGRREGDDGHDRAPLEGGGGPQGSPGVGAEYVYIYIYINTYNRERDMCMYYVGR